MLKSKFVENYFENLTSGHSECRPSIPERHSHEAYGMFSLEVEIAEVLGKDVHIFPNFIGGDSRVNLCGLDVCVAEHLADRLDWHTSSQCHGCRKGVAGKVEYTRQSKRQRTGKN